MKYTISVDTEAFPGPDYFEVLTTRQAYMVCLLTVRDRDEYHMYGLQPVPSMPWIFTVYRKDGDWLEDAVIIAEPEQLDFFLLGG